MDVININSFSNIKYTNKIEYIKRNSYGLGCSAMYSSVLDSLFHFDRLALIMTVLVGFIGVCVASFAARYLKGDYQFKGFFLLLSCMVASVMVFSMANHFIVLFVSWCLSNALLVRLMMHKTCWQAARASGIIAAKNYLGGAVFLAAALVMFYQACGEVTIQAVILQPVDSIGMVGGLLMLLAAAMTQSAIWPFHRWLVSSLNSPTPVSAIMHAGLVNGGGFLLVRFAPLFAQADMLLNVMLCIGVVTAVLGTFWKLIQHDIKRMLACSTMGQMGFMLAQCGLGLFSAAIAHLVLHGLFKAYLFLASGGTAQEKRLAAEYTSLPLAVISAMVCGFAGATGFVIVGGAFPLKLDSSLVLVAVSFLAAAQLSLPLLREMPIRNIGAGMLLTFAAGLFHGMCVHGIIRLLEPMALMQPLPLQSLHLAAAVVFFGFWVFAFALHLSPTGARLPSWMLKAYVQMLNASQPHPKTVTTYRNDYRYV
jgi:NAD(P)H-quinone oxidoreductase subunit 5